LWIWLSRVQIPLTTPSFIKAARGGETGSTGAHFVAKDQHQHNKPAKEKANHQNRQDDVNFTFLQIEWQAWEQQSSQKSYHQTQFLKVCGRVQIE
jgi:hypothetical protein